MDDSGMVAALAEVTEVCEEPQPDWETLAPSENVGSTWLIRRHGVRMVHLEHLREHRVYEELDLSQGVKPLSIRWVDKDDYHTAKSRLTARGYEQELTGQENFSSATPQPATLRVLLVLAQALGLTVAVGDCAQAFLQAPLLEKSDVWVTPPPEAEVQPGRAWRLLKTLPGLKGGPAAWSHHATKVKEQRYGLVQSARDPCVHSNVRERMWTMRHMDDYVIVGPQTKLRELTEDMGNTMLLLDVQALEPGKPPLKFLGWMLERTVDGFRYRRYRARFRAGKLDEEVCHCWCEGLSRGRDPAGERRALVLPNTSGSFIVPVSVTT